MQPKTDMQRTSGHPLLDFFNERTNPVPKDVVKNAAGSVSGDQNRRMPVVVVIDFGTANSGIAIGVRASRHITTFSPLGLARTSGDVMMKLDRKSDKVPTKILLCAKTKQLVAFGEEATSIYDRELKDGLTNGKYLLFENIKMRLDFVNQKSQTAPSEIRVSARCGTSLPILAVLTEMLKHFRATVAAYMSQQTEIMWILTVPTNWKGAAQQIMLWAAKDAGMGPPENVGLALESEAAAVAVNHWLNKQLTPAAASAETGSAYGGRVLVPGEKCGVVDLGGGTCDVTVHTVDRETACLKEATHSGGSCGGVQVDREFDKVLDQTFGGDWMRLYEDRFPVDARELAKSIEALKREIAPATDHKSPSEYRLSLPTTFVEYSGLSKLAPHKSAIVLDTASDPHGTRGRTAPADPPTPRSNLDKSRAFTAANIAAVLDKSRALLAASTAAASIASNANVEVGAKDSKSAVNGVRDLIASGAMGQQSHVIKMGDISLQQMPDKSTPYASGTDQDSEWEDVLRTSRKLKSRVLKTDDILLPTEKRLTYCNGCLKWSAKLAQSMFTKTVEQVSHHVNEICQDPRLSTVFLVGGFSESPLVRAAIQSTIDIANVTRSSAALTLTQCDKDAKDPKDTKSGPAAGASAAGDIVLVCPPDPVRSVLIGAALYGFDPESVRSRVMRHTIGCDRALIWSQPNHVIVSDECEKTPRVEYVNGQKRKDAICHGHFSAMVSAGDIVTVGDRYVDTCHPAEPGQTEMVLRFFSSPNKTVNRIDEPGVEFLGRVTIPMPVCDSGLLRQVRYSIAFGGTHLSVQAFDIESGSPIAAAISFLD